MAPIPMVWTCAGIQRDVSGRFEELFHEEAEALKRRGMREESKLVDDLPLWFRAEVVGARLLRDSGGLLTESGGPRICAGASYLTLNDLGPSFHRHLRDVRAKEDADSDDLVQLFRELKALLGEEEAPDSATETRISELQRHFSPLRFATQLWRENQLEQACERLRETRQILALDEPTDGEGAAGSFPGNALPKAHWGPALSVSDDREAFDEAAASLEIEILLKLGEKCIASQSESFDEALGHWLNAPRPSRVSQPVPNRPGQDHGFASWGAQRSSIVRTARRKALRCWKPREGLVSDERTKGALASLHAGVGVGSINQRRDWRAGVESLRKAWELNPRSTNVSSNLIVALRGRAKERADASDPKRALALLREALTVADARLEQDASDAKTREIAGQIRAELVLVSLANDEALSDDLVTTILGKDKDNATMLSTGYHNKGVEHLNAGRFAEAVEELEKALKFEPKSKVSRKALVAALNARAVELAQGESFDQALAFLDRGLALDWRDKTLRKNKKAITDAKRMNELIQGNADLKELMKLLSEDRRQ